MSRKNLLVSERGKSLLTFLAVLLLGVSVAVAQAPTGSIEGTVTDPTGAVVPNASVKVTELSTGRIIELTTTQTGFYAARSLLPGTYKVEITASGFRTFVIPQVLVLAGQVALGDAQLELGAREQVVEVSAMVGVQVDTSRQTVDGVIRGREINELPLNQRNFLDLAALEPGVIVRDGNSIDPTKANAYRAVGISGRSGTGTRIQMDGVDVTDETVGTTVSNISDDAISEFQLTRSSLDMSTSLTSSGAVSIITKSGGNDFHGSAFYFFRNQTMGARQGFLPAENYARDNPFHRHQVGYQAGGRFIKDKLFWFSNWERDFEGTRKTIGPGASPFFPQLENKSVGLPVKIRYVNERLDWNVKPAMRMFYRFTHSWDVSTGDGGTLGATSLFENIDWTNVHAVGLDYTRGRFTHSYRFGYVNFNNQIVTSEFPVFPWPRTATDVPYQLNLGPYGTGPNSLAPQATYQDNFQNKYDGSFVFGRHTIRYGIELNRIILGGFANFSGPLTMNGIWDPNPGGTRDQVIARGGDPADPTEYPLDSFATGVQSGYFSAPPGHGLPHGGHFNTRLAWYIGDNWRARRNLMLNFGTRWEMDTGYFNNETLKGYEIPRPAYLDYWLPGASRTPVFPKNRFGPQFGFAWDPWSDGKTSIRGGSYVAYEMTIFNILIFDSYQLSPPGIGPDFYDNTFVGAPDPVTGLITPVVVPVTGIASCASPAAQAEIQQGVYDCLLGNPIKIVSTIIANIHTELNNRYIAFSPKYKPTGVPSLFEQSQGGASLFGAMMPGDFKIPYSIQFNIGVQREIKPGIVLTVDYVRLNGVGLPLHRAEAEHRRWAETLNVAAAQAKINSVLGGLTVDQWIAANPGKTIASFGLSSDSIYQGRTPDPNSPYTLLTTTNFTQLRYVAQGFSKYQGLQVKFQGKVRDKLWLFRNTDWVISYALGRSQSSSGLTRVEYSGDGYDSRDVNNPIVFGPNGMDRTHILTAAVLVEIPGGFRFNNLLRIESPLPMTFTVPGFGPVTGANRMFTTDINGDGMRYGGSLRGDAFPTIGVGQVGRKIKSWKELNAAITAFNNQYAGKLTPAGQALVSASLFTEAQLRSLGAVVASVPLAVVTNPWPFQTYWRLDTRISRPVELKWIREGFKVEPYLDVFNVFNHTQLGTYGGLGTAWGTFGYDYKNELADLDAYRGRQRRGEIDNRLLQVGIRITF